MKQKKNITNGITVFFSRFFLVLNLLCIILLLVSAFGGMINPERLSWLVSATLAFPFLFGVTFLFMLSWLVVYSRKWLWSFFALVASALALRDYCPVNVPQPVPKGCIKVETYNVYGFGGASENTVEYKEMLEYLKNSEANIFCAQETSYSEGRKKELEDAISHWRYRDTVYVGTSFSGLTLCSDFPILNRHVTTSPSLGHICAIYRLRVGHDTVVVVNSHFVSNAMNDDDKKAYREIILSPEEKHAKNDFMRLCSKVNRAGQKRAVQVDSLMDYLETLGDVPIIMCGDFNDSPLSYVHHRLTRKLNDAYIASGNGPGISYYRSGMFFRLDNVLCSQHWRSFGAAVKSRYKMSDHYPLEVYLKRMK